MRLKGIWEHYWNHHIIPALYIIVMWLCAVAGVVLFLEDWWKAMGIVSAVSLFNMIKGNYYQEMGMLYTREQANAESSET